MTRSISNHSLATERGTSLPLSLASLALLVLAAALGAAWPAAAQLASPQYSGLVLDGAFQVQVDGELVKEAKVYRSNRPPVFLIMNAGLPAPVLLLPGQGRVETVKIMKLAKRPDGTIDILPGATLAPQGSFQPRGQQSVEFTVGDREVVLGPKPPLLGMQGARDLKEYSASYAERAESYQPDPSAVTYLEQQPKNVRVLVFFGSWCPLCGQTVPHVMALAEELGDDSNVEFEFYGLPRGFGDEPKAKEHGIEAVPTGIVFVDGREAGRVQGNRWLRPEAAIRNILRGEG